MCLVAVALTTAALAAFSQTFDEMLGQFAQRRSGVCVIYAHVMAVAENDPVSFAERVQSTYRGWLVRFADGRRAYVTQEEIDRSIAGGFSAGEPDNLLTIYCIALAQRCAGFKKETGELDYGKLDFGPFLGTGRWTLYDDSHGPGRKLADGLDRLVRETLPDGRLRRPSTVGFGSLDKKSIPRLADQTRNLKLVGGHDFSVSGYDKAAQTVHLRNPHNPKELLKVPINLLRRIPAGIDFMESKP
jgi:hypothetical protein